MRNCAVLFWWSTEHKLDFQKLTVRISYFTFKIKLVKQINHIHVDFAESYRRSDESVFEEIGSYFL